MRQDAFVWTRMSRSLVGYIGPPVAGQFTEAETEVAVGLCESDVGSHRPRATLILLAHDTPLSVRPDEPDRDASPPLRTADVRRTTGRCRRNPPHEHRRGVIVVVLDHQRQW